MPGLIEGASEGVGLGHEFLAHLERARTLVHVIDASADPAEQWHTIDASSARTEQASTSVPQIVVLNKTDLAPDPVFDVDDPADPRRLPALLRDGRRPRRVPPRLFTLVPEPSREEPPSDELADFLVYRPRPKARGWRLLRTEGGFRVLGTPPSDEELERALRAAGAKHGVTVEIGDEEFEFARRVIGLYGGSFDPPHRGHVELARRAKEELDIDPLVVLVSADPGHKHVDTPADLRLGSRARRSRATRSCSTTHARTIDTLRAHPEWRDAVFLIGADEFADFLAWKEPDEILELVRARGRHPSRLPSRADRARPCRARAPGTRLLLRDRADRRRLARPEARLEAGEDVAGELPQAVADELAREPLYPLGGYTGAA